MTFPKHFLHHIYRNSSVTPAFRNRLGPIGLLTVCLLLGGCAGKRAKSDGLISTNAPATAAAAAITVPGTSTTPIHTTENTTTDAASHTIQQVFLTDPLAPNTVDLTIPPTDIWQRIRNGFAVPNIDTDLTQEWEAYYTARPDYVQRMTERAGLYLFHIVEELEQRNMPTEITLLPFIESAYNPMALSSARASGMWQFIPSTGRLYKLKQDGWRDERRDIIASTNAALDYLNNIYEMHGDWHLALASYNWGEGAVKRAIEKNLARGLPTDYLSLNMPKETRNYIPKLQAIKNIIANPAAFNITLPRTENQPYFTSVQKTRDIDVATAAQLAEMPLDEFKALNPSFIRPIILGSQNASILLPNDKVEVFRKNLEQARGPLSRWSTYTFKAGDRLDKVAKKHGMTLASLKTLNNIGKRDRITPGTLLVVPRTAGTNELIASESAIASATPLSKPSSKSPIRTRNIVHIVKSGDTLYSISRKYDVEIREIQNWNKLHGTKLSLGQKLTIQHAIEVAEVSTHTKKVAR